MSRTIEIGDTSGVTVTPERAVIAMGPTDNGRDCQWSDVPIPGEFSSPLPAGRSWGMLIVGLIGALVGAVSVAGLAFGLYALGHPG